MSERLQVIDKPLRNDERLKILNLVANNIWQDVPTVHRQTVDAKAGAHPIMNAAPEGEAYRMILDERLPTADRHREGHIFSEAFFGASGDFQRFVVTDNTCETPSVTVATDERAQRLGDSLLLLMKVS